MFLVAVLSLGPLVILLVQVRGEGVPVSFIEGYSSAAAAWGSRIVVLLAMSLAIGLRAAIDRRDEPWSGPLAILLTVLAGLMLVWHAFWVDSSSYNDEWQRDMYWKILNFEQIAPHQFRALPYGFTRGLEWFTGDYVFSCLAYRWFFSYWFLWGCYRFARMFHGPACSLVVVAPVFALYSLSVLYYWGQLTDPLSHALFVLALIYVIEDRWLALAAALFLGVLAKETVVIVVPAYLACYWRRGWPAFARTVVLGLACVAAFLAARLPLGWHLGYQQINGTEGLNIGSNLGFEIPKLGIYELYNRVAPLYENYLQPFLFVGIFLPFIAWRWRRIDARLRALCLTLVPLLLVSNLCFGWMYESRNYMPLVPLLATMALPVRLK
jgi:hypothetical protein